MPTNCPQCSADTSQASGVVCPACGHILQSGADDLAHEQQVKRGSRGVRLALAFIIPFVLGLACVGSLDGNLYDGLVGGTVLGVVFLGCFALASSTQTSTSTALGQAFYGFVLFLGLIALIASVAFASCSFGIL